MISIQYLIFECDFRLKLNGLYAQWLKIKVMHVISSIVQVKSFNCSPGLLQPDFSQIKFLRFPGRHESESKENEIVSDEKNIGSE